MLQVELPQGEIMEGTSSEGYAALNQGLAIWHAYKFCGRYEYL